MEYVCEEVAEDEHVAPPWEEDACLDAFEDETEPETEEIFLVMAEETFFEEAPAQEDIPPLRERPDVVLCRMQRLMALHIVQRPAMLSKAIQGFVDRYLDVAILVCPQ